MKTYSTTRGELYCPYCGASTLIADPAIERCEVIWDSGDSCFTVKLLINLDNICSSCASTFQKPDIPRTGELSSILIPSTVAGIPFGVFKESRCACGSSLVNEDHALRRNGKYLNFEGKYACKSCQEENNSIIKKIGKAFEGFFVKMKRIEIGSNGIVYEKISNDRDDSSST